MNPSTWLAAAFCCGSLCAGLLSLPPCGRAEEPRPSVLRVGVSKSLFRDTPAPLVQVVMNPFKKYLEAHTGMNGQILVGDDAESLGGQLKDDKVQLGVFQGVEFAWARLKNPKLKPLIVAVSGRPVLHALLVVRADSRAESAADLYGRDLALPRMSKEHCHLFLERRCSKPGTPPAQSFARITTPADPEDALDDVVDGNVQAAVIDGAALDAYRHNKPGRAGKLKTLLQSEPFPCATVAYQPGALDAAVLKRLKAGLLNAPNNRQGQQLLELCKLTAFDVVPANYEQMLLDVVKAYPPARPK